MSNVLQGPGVTPSTLGCACPGTLRSMKRTASPWDRKAGRISLFAMTPTDRFATIPAVFQSICELPELLVEATLPDRHGVALSGLTVCPPSLPVKSCPAPGDTCRPEAWIPPRFGLWPGV